MALCFCIVMLATDSLMMTKRRHWFVRMIYSGINLTLGPVKVIINLALIVSVVERLFNKELALNFQATYCLTLNLFNATINTTERIYGTVVLAQCNLGFVWPDNRRISKVIHCNESVEWSEQLYACQRELK